MRCAAAAVLLVVVLGGVVGLTGGATAAAAAEAAETDDLATLVAQRLRSRGGGKGKGKHHHKSTTSSPTTPTTPTQPTGCVQPPYNGYGGYASPYAVTPFVCSPQVGQPDFYVGLKALSNEQGWSATPYDQWYDLEFIQVTLNSTWGPYYRPLPAPESILGATLQQQQARVLQAAMIILGAVPYAHKHMWNWVPPVSPDWLAFGVETTQGIDCSDFSHFNFNYGLGVQLLTGVAPQGAQLVAPIALGSGEYENKKRFVQGTKLFDVQGGWTFNYDELVAGLQPGDLLYIRGDPAFTYPVTHVIMFLGSMAADQNGIDQYLVMDSHGGPVTDSNGVVIPSGPQIRPFRNTTRGANGYYVSCFDHVVRWLPLKLTEEP